MYINDWVTIQDIGGSKGFRGICNLRAPFSSKIYVFDLRSPKNVEAPQPIKVEFDFSKIVLAGMYAYALDLTNTLVNR